MSQNTIKNTYALITGASKGLGKSIATKLAARGYNLALVARSSHELEELCETVSAKYGVKASYLSINLADPTSPETMLAWLKENNLQVSILINNAGYGLWGNFANLPLADQLDMCRLNMDTVVKLSHLLLPELLSAEKSYILNVASTAAYQAVPTLALYSATKAFVLSFTRALRFETRNTSLSVSCLSPGPIDTGFAERAGLAVLNKMAEKFNMQADEVAEIAVKGMFAKKSEIIPGFSNLISVYANRILPKALIEKVASGIYKH